MSPGLVWNSIGLTNSSTGFLGRMDAGLLALLVDVPDGPLVRRWLALGRLALDPAIEARLVRPHVVRAIQHAARLHPDDGLVHEEPALLPRLLDERLAPRGVPLVH